MFKGKLSPDATRLMLQVATNRPDVNRGYIENDGLRLMGLREQTQVLDQLGIQVNPDMITTPARILPAPRVTYKAGAASIKDASWNILNVKFHDAADMSKWAVLMVKEGRREEFRDANDPQFKEFIAAWMKKCQNSGLTVGQPTILTTPELLKVRDDPHRRSALATIRNTLTQGLNPSKALKPRLVLVLLADIDDYIYPGIKRLCDMELGMATQIMLLGPRKARVPDSRKQDQYFSNVALKVNVKLGGINHMLADNDRVLMWLRQKKTMLVGIDVTHPSPLSAKGTPSIVSVLASVDDRFVQFPVSMGLQRNRNVNKDAEEVSVFWSVSHKPRLNPS